MVISASPWGIIAVTEDTAVTIASRHWPVLQARLHPPKACICPLNTIAAMGTRMIESQKATFSRARRSSELIFWNRLASVASFTAWASSPTAVTTNRPVPTSTAVPESTISSRRLGTGSDSPVSMDSSRSSPEEAMTTPSAGT